MLRNLGTPLSPRLLLQRFLPKSMYVNHGDLWNRYCSCVIVPCFFDVVWNRCIKSYHGRKEELRIAVYWLVDFHCIAANIVLSSYSLNRSVWLTVLLERLWNWTITQRGYFYQINTNQSLDYLTCPDTIYGDLH